MFKHGRYSNRSNVFKQHERFVLLLENWWIDLVLAKRYTNGQNAFDGKYDFDGKYAFDDKYDFDGNYAFDGKYAFDDKYAFDL